MAEADDTQTVSEFVKSRGGLDTVLEDDMAEIRRADDKLCWFHGRISRETAAKRLREAAAKHRITSETEAVFLVREREKGGNFCLSMIAAGQPYHVIIEEQQQSFYRFQECETVQGLECLIEKYSTNLSWEGLHATLKAFPHGTPPPHASRRTGHTTFLHRAVSEGDSDLVRQILDHSYCPDVNAKDSQGSTALHLAALHGLDEVVVMLLEAGAFINITDSSGCTALHQACKGNNASTVRMLVETGHCDPDVQCTVTGWTPLHEAAKSGSVDCVKTLLELNASAHIKASESETPRDVAAKYGQADVLKEFDKRVTQDDAKTNGALTSHARDTDEKIPGPSRGADAKPQNLDRKEEWKVNTAEHKTPYPKLDESTAERLFAKHGMKAGQYILREPDDGSYVLSVCFERKVCHYPVEVLNHKGRTLYHLEFGPMFSSLERLIHYFSTFEKSGLRLSTAIDTSEEDVKTGKTDTPVSQKQHNAAQQRQNNSRLQQDATRLQHQDTSRQPHKATSRQPHQDTSPLQHPGTSKLQQQDKPRLHYENTSPRPHKDTSRTLLQDKLRVQHQDTPRLQQKDTPRLQQKDTTSPAKHQDASLPQHQDSDSDDSVWEDEFDDYYSGDSNDKKRPGYENYDITTHTPRRQKSAVFDQEPLYQWYAADQIMRISGSVSDSDAAADSGSSSYENVERILQRAASISAEDEEAPVSENTVKARRTVIREVFSQTGSLLRAMWFEMPEVVDSGVLQFMSDQEKQAQEAMFEIITSEASYHKSLGVLESVFIRSAELSPDGNEFCIISKDEFQHLFSNILDIRRISAEFLADLEARWQESHVITDICDIIAAHAKKNFKPYIQYCGYQAFQDQTLKRLLKRTDFAQAVRRLERHHDCQCLPLASFLMLPMQRITRLPLLVDAVQHRVDPMSPQHATAKEAFIQLQSLVKKCNEEAKKMEQTQQMLQLRNKMKFGDTKEFPLVSQSRYLEKEGELKRITADATMRFPFSRDKPNSRKEPLYIFLFSDILVVTKKRGDKYIVQDYCPRQHLDTQIITSKEATWLASSYSFLLTLNSNHLGEKVELLLSADTESERTRWLEALSQSLHNSRRQKDYEDWDCPQVVCVEKYMAREHDELPLEQGDVVSVLRKMDDGWYWGQRIRDGSCGWFPSQYTHEIENAHVRLRNLRLQARLMEATQKAGNK